MTKKEPVTEIPEELMQELEGSGAKPEEPEAKKEDDANDKYIRLAADFDNFRKRVHKEKSEYVKYSNENLVRDLLPALDNFERAIEHADPNDPNPIVSGVRMIFSQITATLQKYGIRSESAVGKEFDPMVHEAVNHVFSNDVPEHMVIQEHQKAYFLHDRLIRPAMVSVSKGPEGPTPGENISDPQTN